MGSATGTSKGHAKTIRWVLYGGEANREAKKRNALRASADTPESTGTIIEAAARMDVRSSREAGRRTAPKAASQLESSPARFNDGDQSVTHSHSAGIRSDHYGLSFTIWRNFMAAHQEQPGKNQKPPAKKDEQQQQSSSKKQQPEQTPAERQADQSKV